MRWRASIAAAVTALPVAVGLGTAAFNMQDVLLEPYGGEIMQLGVGATTQLTALMAGGALLGFALPARTLARGGDPQRVAASACCSAWRGFRP